jgi:hypothetical protein
MAKTKTVSWGKGAYEVKNLNETGAAFVAFPTPVEGTTQVSTEAGETLEAKIEGGEVVAIKQTAKKYTAVFDCFITPEDEIPIQDMDGVVGDEYAIRFTPQKAGAIGWMMDRASVSVDFKYATNDGAKKTYTFTALKPEEGAMLKQYIAPVE